MAVLVLDLVDGLSELLLLTFCKGGLLQLIDSQVGLRCETLGHLHHSTHHHPDDPCWPLCHVPDEVAVDLVGNQAHRPRSRRTAGHHHLIVHFRPM